MSYFEDAIRVKYAKEWQKFAQQIRILDHAKLRSTKRNISWAIFNVDFNSIKKEGATCISTTAPSLVFIPFSKENSFESNAYGTNVAHPSFR